MSRREKSEREHALDYFEKMKKADVVEAAASMILELDTLRCRPKRSEAERARNAAVKSEGDRVKTHLRWAITLASSLAVSQDDKARLHLAQMCLDEEFDHPF